MFNFKIYTVENDSEREYGPKKGEVRVNFPDSNQDFSTSVDEQGHRYFPIPNVLNEGGKGLNCLFLGKIKDAVECIRAGYGDCIQASQMFGPLGFKSIKVIRFEDRVYGEELRQKSLEGWKDTVFGWGLECGYTNTFSGLSPICEDFKSYNPFFKPEEQSPVLFFKTEEEAVETKEKIFDEVNSEFLTYDPINTDEGMDVWLKNFENKYGMNSVHDSLFSNLLAQRDKEDNNFRIRITQVVKCK